MKSRVIYQLFGEIMEQGITQRELAKKSGISESSISKYANAVKTPTITKVEQLADALGCELVLVKKGAE